MIFLIKQRKRPVRSMSFGTGGSNQLDLRLLTVPVFLSTGVGTTNLYTTSLTDFDEQDDYESGQAGSSASSQSQCAGPGYLTSETTSGQASATIGGVGGNGSTAPQEIQVHGAQQGLVSDTDSSPPDQTSNTKSQEEDDAISTSGGYTWNIVNSDGTPLPASVLTVSFSVSYSTDVVQQDQGVAGLQFDSNFIHVSLNNGTNNGLVITDANQNVIYQNPDPNNGSVQVSLKIPIAAGTQSIPEQIAFNSSLRATAGGPYHDETVVQKVSLSYDFSETVSADS